VTTAPPSTKMLIAIIAFIKVGGGGIFSTSCTIGGQTFNPVDVLFADVRALLATLKTGAAANPVMGYVVNGTNGALAGVNVSILGTSNTATTDSTGFYFFANTLTLALGSSFTTQVTGFPNGFTTSTPAAQTFTWQGAAVSLGNFVLGK
jgi:hypothetical protein